MELVQKNSESSRVLAFKFIEAYPNVDGSNLEMVWNGKRGVAFSDANQSFREQVIFKVLEEDPYRSNMELVYQLMHEEAHWASKTLMFRYYLTELLEMLMLNDLRHYEEKIVRTFTECPYALKCIVDFKAEDKTVERWVITLKRSSKLNPDETMNYESLIDEFNNLLKTRHGQREDAEAFEKYVTHKDPWHIALLKQIRHLWEHGETTWLALFFIIPITLLMGYYLFGFAILYGMLPFFRALITLYLIYRIANWVVL